MASSMSGLSCGQALLAGFYQQRIDFVHLKIVSMSGLNKSVFSKSQWARNRYIRCHTEPQVLESLDRAACPAVKTEIDHSTFSTMDLRVGLITDAKPVLDPIVSAKRGKPTDSRHYLQLTVDIGCETRTMVSQCRYVMDVEDAVGKKVLVVANVAPEEILGIKSHGLILTGFNYDPTPMPRSFKVILPGLGRLPPGSQVAEVAVPK